MTIVSATLSEKRFERQVKDAAAMFGCLYYHTHRSQFSPAGFPDCVIVKPRGGPVIYAELKAEKGKLSDDQRTWLWWLCQAGQRVYLWRPSSLDQIIETLR